MFASLKSKIREETGSDITKITSSWRSGAFLGRGTSSAMPISPPGGNGDVADELSPQLEAYLQDRASERSSIHSIDAIIEDKLKERDKQWEARMEDLKSSLSSVQGEEARAAQGVARAATAAAAAEIARRAELEQRLAQAQEAAKCALSVQDKLDALTEELESARREWGRERGELRVSLGAAESQLREAREDLQLLRATLPPSHPQYCFEEEECAQSDAAQSVGVSPEIDPSALQREQAVLRRQLQEARLALADVKTSWSGQIASLETQVARLSRQAGEEGAERRRVVSEREELRSQLAEELEHRRKMEDQLANSEAKVTRLSGEARSLAAEVKLLRVDQARQGELSISLECKLEEAQREIDSLGVLLEEERCLMNTLRDGLEDAQCDAAEKKTELDNSKAYISELQTEYNDLQRRYEKECSEKDEALMRNAHMSQTIELSQCDVRELETEIQELKTNVEHLQKSLDEQKAEKIACQIIRDTEIARLSEISDLKKENKNLCESRDILKKTVVDLENQLTDKNKNIRTLQCRIGDMKKTLQRELKEQTGKNETSSLEDADISRKYLKHVVMRFLTARELEARQLTRALAALLRLSAQEEAMLQAAVPPRNNSPISAWFTSRSPT